MQHKPVNSDRVSSDYETSKKGQKIKKINHKVKYQGQISV